MMVVIAGDVLLEEDERDAYLEAHSDLVTRARVRWLHRPGDHRR
jgi:hypothetical protein